MVWKKVAKIKAIAEREKQYLGWINFFMIGYLFLDKVGWHWWYIFIIPFVPMWAWFEVTFIMPHENDYNQKKTPMTVETYNNVKIIKNILEDK